MEFVQPHLAFLVRHLLGAVFIISLVDATGVPFPGRIVLVIAGTLAVDSHQLLGLIVAGTLGSLAGDHIPYLAGALMGPRVLAWYCRVTLGSADCVENTARYFRRFGTAAVLLVRFSAPIRLFASALSGSGHIAYWRFLALDLVGTLGYVTFWVMIGHFMGARAVEVLGHHTAVRLAVLIWPLALVTIIAHRLWRRRRYGSARADALIAESSCAETHR
jgi:membrane protein DedA with SNARE-associated domain